MSTNRKTERNKIKYSQVYSQNNEAYSKNYSLPAKLDIFQSSTPQCLNGFWSLKPTVKNYAHFRPHEIRVETVQHNMIQGFLIQNTPWWG